jgi:Divergent InlB B-repeat domain
MRCARFVTLVLAAGIATGGVARDHGPVQVSPEVKHDTLDSLRDAPVQPDGYLRWHERDEHRIPLPYFPPGQVDGAVQSALLRGPFVPTFQTGVDGVGKGFTGPNGSFTVHYAPPDTVGAVGATQYLQVVNDGLAVFDKATKSVVYGPVPTNTLWAGFGGQCEDSNDGDAVVVYDKAANRWVVSQFAVSATPYLQCVAVSQNSDATGTWYRYAFSYGSVFPDYPKMGVWPDAYYETFNMFTNVFVGSQLCAYDRAAMLTGAAATQQCFQLSSSYGGVLPSDLDGSTPPPAGAPNYMLNFGTNSLNLWKFHVDWETPANTALSGPTNLSVAAFTPACNGGACIPQSGTHQNLDSLADRLMYRLAYRNFGDHESLVVNHAVTVGTSHKDPYTGVRWYEIRSPGSTPVVYQQSTFSPDSSYRWMGSITMDKNGNMALGYSVSSDVLYPAIRYTGRLSGDLPNTMQAETSIIEGAGSQSGGNLDRWGDYSAMTIDPVDDCTFWYTTEYLQETGAFNWHTRIGSLKFSACGGPTHTVTPSVGTGNGAISPSNAEVVADGSTPAFMLTPDTGYHIASVGGSCGGSLDGSTYTTDPVTADCTVIANFAIDTFAVTPSVSGGNGTISPNVAQTVDYGATTQFILMPATHYHIASVDGSCGGSLNGSTYTTAAVTADCTVIASFAIDTFTVTPSVDGGHGSISPSTPQSVAYNATTQFGLVPDFGYHIDGVSGSCDGSLDASTYTTSTVTADCSVIASFALDGPTLVFTLQPADVIAGNALATIEVTEEDPFGSPIDDNSGMVDFTVAACGGSVDLGSATLVHGVATLDTAVRFYTVTDPSTLQVGAQMSALTATSDGFVVKANPDLAFSDGFDSCRP